MTFNEWFSSSGWSVLDNLIVRAAAEDAWRASRDDTASRLIAGERIADLRSGTATWKRCIAIDAEHNDLP